MAKFEVGGMNVGQCTAMSDEIGAVIGNNQIPDYDDADKIREAIEKKYGKGSITIAFREMLGRFHREKRHSERLQKRLDKLTKSVKKIVNQTKRYVYAALSST